MNQDSPQDDRYCVFQSGENGYGIPALSVLRVTERPQLTGMPQSDPVLRGVCHMQNEFLPVFSLIALSQIQYERSHIAEQQLLVLPGPNGNWGLLIDEALGLADLEISISTLSTQDDAWSKVVSGSATFKNQVLQIIDPAAVHDYANNLLNMFWQDQEVACSANETSLMSHHK